jgi:hypothetical protein
MTRERYPHSLVARFNGIRVMLHLGTPELVSEALALLDETLRLPASHWQVDVMEDVFPWDFFPQFFNYRGYFDRVTDNLMRETPVERDLCRLLLASLHAYRGFYPSGYGFHSQSLDDFQKAVELDPDFPYFKFWYAEQLLKSGLPEDHHIACKLLEELANGSLIFQEAFELLEVNGGPCEPFMRRIGRARAILDVRENIEIPKLRPDLREVEQKRTLSLQDVESWQAERDHLYRHIRAIESSKFWKLRQLWFGLKRFLRLERSNPPVESENPLESDHSPQA